MNPHGHQVEQRQNWLFVTTDVAAAVVCLGYLIARAFCMSLFTKNLEQSWQLIFSLVWGNYARWRGSQCSGRVSLTTTVFTIQYLHSAGVTSLGLGIALQIISGFWT